MKGNQCLTKEQLQEFKKILEEKKRELIEDIKRGILEEASAEREVGDLVDMSTEEILRTFEMRIRDREAKYLKKIEKALQKIEEGTYGICEECGKCISYERLKLRPVAELCINCKLKQEKLERKFGEE
ncbi:MULTISPECIES: TraR/DksA family transcriptional regulator [unclassified Desulfurobacterium]|uniref:TraR/DksA family transcriptional regulator n=1 Tax=unclassified Desulfurobacterium TaxID=2639089 RepID=UPI0003B5386E|nr:MULTISPECIES: TraR/DksA family transcriptional regulator [unclassified Desulfurobacterium]